MDDLQAQLGAMLQDPQIMQKIQAMAQSLQGGESQGPTESPVQGLDLNTVKRLTSLASKSTIDKREQNLLRALGAYLSKERIQKLEKAMKAAKLASALGPAMGQTGR